MDTVIQTRGISQDFRKAKNTRLAASVFLRFSQVLQIPKCLNYIIQTQESIWYFLNTSVILPAKELRIPLHDLGLAFNPD